MSEKNILSISFVFPGDFAEFVAFNSSQSLSDADIIIFRPDISDLLVYHHIYKGKPSLTDNSSFKLVESLGHWSRELSESILAGKTIFVFLSKLSEVYVDTGEGTYSGTGRNRQETRIVSSRHNYESIPLQLKFVTSEGSSLKLSQNSELISAYWKEFSEISYYNIHIEGDEHTRLIESRDGRKTLGALVKFKDREGVFVLLPDIYIDTEAYYDDEKETWTQNGKKFGQRLLSSLLEIDKALKSTHKITPAPIWSKNTIYNLPKEEKVYTALLNLENRITKLEEKKKKLKSQAYQENKIRGLLYEKGPALEEQIIFTLKLMGFEASPFKDSESEFDVVFECKEGRFIGEAEGKDNKAINIDKLRQLEMNIHEDYSREEIDEIATGALFGNAFRLSPLEERKDFFTEKCLKAVKRSGTVLVKTPDLFIIARYLSTNADIKFAAECRKAIFESKGEIVKFPTIPKNR